MRAGGGRWQRERELFCTYTYSYNACVRVARRRRGASAPGATTNARTRTARSRQDSLRFYRVFGSRASHAYFPEWPRLLFLGGLYLRSLAGGFLYTRRNGGKWLRRLARLAISSIPSTFRAPKPKQSARHLIEAVIVLSTSWRLGSWTAAAIIDRSNDGYSSRFSTRGVRMNINISSREIFMRSLFEGAKEARTHESKFFMIM